MGTVWIDGRFRGPARSGHGGYVAGLVGSSLETAGPVRVRLRLPPPLETELDLTGGTLSGPAGVIAEAHQVNVLLQEVDPVTPDEVRAAEASYAGMTDHPFPTCYGCGPDNEDGLRLRPGRATDRRTACRWRPVAGPGGLVAVEDVWAAMDCPGGWTIVEAARPSVLGQLTLDIAALPEPDEPCVLMGGWLGDDGRKTFAATTLYGADGRVLARADQVWITVDPRVFG
jgi:hypothetical protein